MKKFTPILALLALTLILAACGPAVVSGTDAPTELGTLETSTAGPSVSAGTVDELIAMVNGFVTNGEITGQAENGLLAKLDTINKKVTKGQIDPAVNELGAFINQVQAQSGKKITTEASDALIAKAQVVAAELMAGIPVTGAESTVVPATAVATDAAMEEMSKPSPMGDNLRHQAKWDAIALQVVQSVGFSTFAYDLYQLPANTAWDDTLAHYNTKAAVAGWGDASSQTNEFAGGHYAVWSIMDDGTNGLTNYFVVAQVDTADGIYTLNIIGSK